MENFYFRSLKLTGKIKVEPSKKKILDQSNCVLDLDSLWSAVAIAAYYFTLFYMSAVKTPIMHCLPLLALSELSSVVKASTSSCH